MPVALRVPQLPGVTRKAALQPRACPSEALLNQALGYAVVNLSRLHKLAVADFQTVALAFKWLKFSFRAELAFEQVHQRLKLVLAARCAEAASWADEIPWLAIQTKALMRPRTTAAPDTARAICANITRSTHDIDRELACWAVRTSALPCLALVLADSATGALLGAEFSAVSSHLAQLAHT